jgi:hypothetical protein
MMNDLIPIIAASPLRQRLIDDMTMRRFSREAQRNYIRDVERFGMWLGAISPHCHGGGRSPVPDQAAGGGGSGANDEQHRGGAKVLLHPHARPARNCRSPMVPACASPRSRPSRCATSTASACCSVSSAARVDDIATPCCPKACCRCCGSGGARDGNRAYCMPTAGSSQARMRWCRSAHGRFIASSSKRLNQQTLPSGSDHTHCDIIPMPGLFRVNGKDPSVSGEIAYPESA